MKRLIALAGAALVVCNGPASATLITNTFVGHVIYADNTGFDPVTTNDTGNYGGGFFGGGSLLGDSFTLTMTFDTAIIGAGNSFTVGGSYYFGPNPITATLTINGQTAYIGGPNDLFGGTVSSSDAYYGDSGYGPNEKFLQVFDRPATAQGPAVAVDLTTVVAASTDLTVPLPAMRESNGDYVNNFASFYDYTSGPGEVLNLDVQAVNTSQNAVPEPTAFASLAVGLVTLGLGRRRRAG
jgi:hypothetical protein